MPAKSMYKKHLHVQSLITCYIWLATENKRQVTYRKKGSQKRKMSNSQDYRM